MELEISRFFTLEEAAALLPQVRKDLKRAHRELASLYQQVVLYKRLHNLQYDERLPEAKQSETVLATKVEAFEAAHKRWIEHFAEKGMLLRDIQRGLLDFPYQSQDGELFFLCWHLGEEGIFYFHEIDEGYRNRKPIALLPD